MRLFKSRVVSCAALFGIMLICTLAVGAQFEADLVTSRYGKSTTGKIYVKDALYRMDQEEGGQKIVIIVDQEKGITRAFLPAKKMYVEMNTTDPRSLMNDPFQGTKFLATRLKPEKTGRETLNGFECDIYTFKDQGKELVVEWISSSLGFPLKIVNHSTNRTVELKNVRTGPPDDSLFQIPNGYSMAGTRGPSPGADKVKSEKAVSQSKSSIPAGEKSRVQSFLVKGEGRDFDFTSVEKKVNPNMKLALSITGNCPAGSVSKGKVSVFAKGYQKLMDIPFSLENGTTKNWEFPVGKHIEHLIVGVYGIGEARVTIRQRR